MPGSDDRGKISKVTNHRLFKPGLALLGAVSALLTIIAFIEAKLPSRITDGEVCHAAAADPEDPASDGRGVVKIENPVAAMNSCRRAIALNDIPKYHHELARAMVQVGQVGGAIDEYCTKASTYAISAVRCGELLFLQRQYDAALPNFLLAASANLRLGKYWLGRFYMEGYSGDADQNRQNDGIRLISEAADQGSPEARRFLRLRQSNARF
jgi:hypothetical protein